MKKHLTSALRLASASFVLMACGLGQVSRTSAVQVADIAIDSDVAQVEHLLPNGASKWSRPAPVIWSSRLEVRWNARWLNTPRYAV